MEVKEEATVITDGDKVDGDKVVDVDSTSTSASTTITPSLFDRTNEDKRAFQQELDRRFDDKRRLVENTTLDGREPKCTFWGGETGILGPTQIPTDIDFTNTVIAGYPGADKRMVLRQAEAFTTLSGRDSWDMKFLGLTRQPYIKTNYPHHEGIWGWQDVGDQSILVVRSIRWSIDEYHDILADIDYAKTWAHATEMIPNLYKGTVFEVLYNAWRDERTMDEIGWYGWFVDYWMEGGILRDYFDHKLTTPYHWGRLRAPELWTYGELQWDYNNCETDGPITEISYDEVCDPALTTFDCQPKIIISAERLMDNSTGKVENDKIAQLLNVTPGIQDFMVNQTMVDCIYDELIGDNPNGEAPLGSDPLQPYTDYRAREGLDTRKHHVSIRHLTKMVKQLTRMITKYSSNDPETGIDWRTKETAQFLVEILTVHRDEIQVELDATPQEQNWAHPPRVNWYIFPKCGPNAEGGRRVWDYDYSDWLGEEGFSGLVMDMDFPDASVQ